MLDRSKRYFLSSNCLSDEPALKHVMKILGSYKIPKDNILKETDLSLASSGDYIIRCRG